MSINRPWWIVETDDGVEIDIGDADEKAKTINERFSMLLCKNCDMMKVQHGTGGKCLFDPTTTFEPKDT